MVAMSTGSSLRRLSPELLLSGASMLLSLGVLVVTLAQTSIARSQMHASAWPFLAPDTHHMQGRDIKFTLRNKGVGPALIKKVEFRHGSEVYPSLFALFRGRFGAIEGSRHWSSVGPGDVLQAGEELDLFRLAPDDKDTQRFDALTQSDAYAFDVIYGDVYDNCWLMQRSRVTRLPRCPE